MDGRRLLMPEEQARQGAEAQRVAQLWADREARRQRRIAWRRRLHELTRILFSEDA